MCMHIQYACALQYTERTNAVSCMHAYIPPYGLHLHACTHACIHASVPHAMIYMHACKRSSRDDIHACMQAFLKR